MAARHLYASVEKCKMCPKVTVFNFSVCGFKANTWQTLGKHLAKVRPIKCCRQHPRLLDSDLWEVVSKLFPLN